MDEELEKWLYLFNSGADFESYRRFGAHQIAPDRWVFLVWAPHAHEVAVIGDFNDWQGQPLSPVAETGVWRGEFDAKLGQLYKFQVTDSKGSIVEKIDPYGFAFELKPGTATRLTDLPAFAWHDEAWLATRRERDANQAPLNIYEVHLGSFMKTADGGYLSYREAIKQLIPYVKKMGYTHIEFLPLTEHPLDASWGYQASGFFAPTSRFGTPEDFAALVNAAHRANLGVIMDWVPSHFIRNSDSLALYDGTPTFEYVDPHRADNVRWGTWNFDLGKAQVQSFLISSAMYWLDQFHLDGLRVDAVSNMIYRDYDAGKEQDRNQFGGRENLEGVSFLKKLNSTVLGKHPDILMIAEESSAFPLVSAPVAQGGLGFSQKWNMGWMNDTLRFFELAPQDRGDQMSLLTFSFMYMFNEQFVLPFSHDEVVHGKKSLMHKMPGDRYNQFANLRVMRLWQMTHPGKKLLFMGSEWGQFLEWRDWSSLEWVDLKDPLNAAMQVYSQQLNRIYKRRKSLWEQDHTPLGIDITIADTPEVLSYVRRAVSPKNLTVVALNLTPQQREHFRIPVPYFGTYEILLNTEAQEYGGTWTQWQATLTAVNEPYKGQPAYIETILPALGGLLIKPKRLRQTYQGD